MMCSCASTRRLCLLAVFLLALAGITQAQTSSSPTTKLSSHAELVSVPVIVTDKTGAHIRDLKKEDFTVLEDGKEQPVAVFEEFHKPDAPVKAAPTTPDQFTNLPATEGPPRPAIIVLLDFLNTPVADQIYARDQVIKYLTETTSDDQPISLLVLNRTGARLIHHFTNDRKQLLAALGQINRSQQPVLEDPSTAMLSNHNDKISDIVNDFGKFQIQNEQAALSIERRGIITLTLQSMQQIAQAFAGFPGRKTLVWASGGFPFNINETSMALTESGAGLDTLANLAPVYEHTWAVLNRAQVSIYPVDVHGLGDLPGPATGYIHKELPDQFQHGQWVHADTNATFDLFARATGGRFFINKNGLANAIEKAEEDNSSYYMLAYYLHSEGKKPGWHKLNVKVHSSDVQVVARTGFFIGPTKGKAPDTSKDEMQIALDSEIDYTGVPITVKWQETQPDTDAAKRKAFFLLTMPPNFAEVDESDNNHFAVEFWVAARTLSGAAAGDTEQTLEANFKPESLEKFRTHGTDYRASISLAPGEYNVRFILRDRLSGRMGTVSAPLKVAP